MRTTSRSIAPPASAVVETVYRDGIAGMPQAFPPQWADELREDFAEAFAQARSRPDGTVGRGPHRYYFSVHPERVRRFVDLLCHAGLAEVYEAVLGPDYQVVEVGFDVPLPGAIDQPWHRDFPTPPETRERRVLSSLAVNVTTVDVTPELAPFEVAPGTHWDAGNDFDHGMFPGPEAARRYTALGSKRYPRRGDLSVRTGLTLHRGTAHRGEQPRAVLIIGVVTAELAADPDTGVHEIVVTRDYHAALPEPVRRHLRCTVVDELSPLVQKHDIEGLVMG